MAMKNQRKLIKDTCLVLVGLFIAIGLAFPVSAQTSLSGIAECAKSPSCASQLGIQTAIRNGATTNNVVPFTLKVKKSSGLVEKAINTLGIVGLSKIIGIGDDSIKYGGITESGIEKIKQAAIEAAATSASGTPIYDSPTGQLEFWRGLPDAGVPMAYSGSSSTPASLFKSGSTWYQTTNIGEDNEGTFNTGIPSDWNAEFRVPISGDVATPVPQDVEWDTLSEAAQSNAI